MHERSPSDLIRAISRLPEDEPVDDPRKWYRTQKEHWLRWLSQYGGPGTYGRKGGPNRDARFVYNHIVEPKMLLWLIEAAGLDPGKVEEARRDAAEAGPSMMAKSGAIRRRVPWEDVARALWPERRGLLAWVAGRRSA